jgi:hypothetical protein
VVDAVAAAAAAWVWLWVVVGLGGGGGSSCPGASLLFLGRTGAGCFLFRLSGNLGALSFRRRPIYGRPASSCCNISHFILVYCFSSGPPSDSDTLLL